jgi:hypothetical protein
MAASEAGEVAVAQKVDAVKALPSSAELENDRLAPYRSMRPAVAEIGDYERRRHDVDEAEKRATESLQMDALHLTHDFLFSLPNLAPYAAMLLAPGAGIAAGSLGILGLTERGFRSFTDERLIRVGRELTNSLQTSFDIPKTVVKQVEKSCEKQEPPRAPYMIAALEGSAGAYAGYRFGGVYGAIAGGLLGIGAGVWSVSRTDEANKQPCIGYSLRNKVLFNLDIPRR